MVAHRRPQRQLRGDLEQPRPVHRRFAAQRPIRAHRKPRPGEGPSRSITADQTYSFFRLFGDYNGDGIVNNADYMTFKKAYGAAVGSATYSTYWYFDYYFDN